MQDLRGIIIPMVTPFHEDGRLCTEKLARNIEKWNRTGISGYMCLGSNGEFKSLTDDESVEVIHAFLQAADPKKVRIVGIGRESLAQTLQFMSQLDSYLDHIDYFSVITPCYFRKQMTDEALFLYYSRIADAAARPILLYTAPSYANQVVISPALLQRLADHPNIAGIKDTSPDMMIPYMDAVGEKKDFHILAGSISNLICAMERGGKGGVVSAANYLPDICVKLVDLFNQGDHAGAKEMQARLKEMMARTATLFGVSGVKACMDLMGYEGGFPRIPLLPVSPEKKKEMTEIFNSYKLE